jgi:chitin disaccharide deacetylase
VREGRTLIVNADDFGQSNGINRGIAEAHENGVVTSTSLMVRWPTAAAAAEYARAHPELSLGLHFDLGEWYLREGTWHARYQVLPSEETDEVAAELRRQVRRFRELAGADPTHIDSHQHVHVAPHARAATLEIAEELGVPARHLTSAVNYLGSFYGQDSDGRPIPEAIRVESLVSLITTLSADVTELACHPGYADERTTTYAAPRAKEIRTLTDPLVRAAIEREGIRLRSFRALLHAH